MFAPMQGSSGRRGYCLRIIRPHNTYRASLSRKGAPRAASRLSLPNGARRDLLLDGKPPLSPPRPWPQETLEWPSVPRPGDLLNAHLPGLLYRDFASFLTIWRWKSQTATKRTQSAFAHDIHAAKPRIRLRLRGGPGRGLFPSRSSRAWRRRAGDRKIGESKK